MLQNFVAGLVMKGKILMSLLLATAIQQLLHNNMYTCKFNN
jgi:hypothetical protein